MGVLIGQPQECLLGLDTQHVIDGFAFTAQLLACIGEQFTEGDEICGIVVNVRAKQDKLCIWTKTAANEAAQANPAPLLEAPARGGQQLFP